MQIEAEFEFQIKLAIIGDSAVGKTNFIFRFIDNLFSSSYVTTVGFDYKSKIVKLPKSKKRVKIQIWDTAGQERYMSLNKNIFQKVQGIIIMYDLTKRISFENINRWLNLMSQYSSDKVKFLVANKLDLAENQRIVSEDEGQQLADENNMKFFEASGQSGENVDKIFIEMAELVYENLTNEKFSLMSESTSVQLTKKNTKKKKKFYIKYYF